MLGVGKVRWPGLLPRLECGAAFALAPSVLPKPRIIPTLSTHKVDAPDVVKATLRFALVLTACI